MRGRISEGVLVLVLVASVPAGSGTAFAWDTGPLPQSGNEPATPVENPFDKAREAATTLAFTGTVDVDWDGAGGRHSDHLRVQAAGGSLEVRGESTLMAESEGARMVRRPGGKWDLLWSGPEVSPVRPALGEKYEVATVAPPEPVTVASRPTEIVEIRQAGTVRERLFVDAANGLLLKREQLDGRGHATRVVAFSSIDLEPDTSPPPSPPRLTDESPDRLKSVSAPAALPGGYRRLDAYREDDTVHVLYSDGLYDLSVFRQRGALDDGDLPASGTRVKIGSGRGWVYGWPGGQVLVWEAGHSVFSLVSEAPTEDLVAVARALPTDGGGSVVDRMRRVCHNLLEPLSP